MSFRNTFLLFFLALFGLVAQELPPIQNFYPKDYNGENQNWDISQASDKLIYVANSKGLLEFNGALWTLYPSPNETIMRSVKVVGDRIYTGCFMEFGYWKKNDLGTLNYTSLSQKINTDLIEDEEFWNILHVDDYMVFQSLKRIYIYDISKGTVNTIDSTSTITKMFKVGQSVYFQRLGEGLFRIRLGKDFLILDDEVLRNYEVIHVFGSEKDLLILTRDNGFYTVKDDVLVQSDRHPNEVLSNFSLYDGIRLKDNSFLLGTISNGVIYLSATGELVFQIDQDNGLSNNTVLSLFEDVDHNLWLGLDHGISYVNRKSPYKVFNDYKGILGSVYAAAVYGQNLYLGTNQGLFYKRLNSSNGFNFIEGTQGQVWSLRKIDTKLLCGHNSGTFLIEDDQIQKIFDVQGTWDIAALNDNPNVLLQGNYDGLYVLKKSGTSWQLKNKIGGFDNSSRYFETLGNEIFVNHEYNGVFKLKADDSFFEIKNVVKDTAIKGSNSGLVKYNGDVLYAYKNGIFKFDTHSGEFTKDSLLSGLYDEGDYESGKLIVDEADNRLWVFTKSNVSFVTPTGLTNTPKIRNIPLTKEMREGILGYENIIKLDDNGNYLLGKTSGYITLNINEVEVKDFQVHMANVSNGVNRIDQNLSDHRLKGSFSSTRNNFEFLFYAPEYNKYVKTQYQYRLQGIYDEWSDWSSNTGVFYENLPFGDYVFEVRGKIGNSVSSNMASYTFQIAKPWYISNVMVAIYILGILLFSFFMHNMYKQYYKKQRLKLIEKNKKELELAQVRNEKEIIKIKNEQLELENKSKGKELAVSTMSIIKKNELLATIKSELNAMGNKEVVKPVIKIIDKSVRGNDDWELFQEAFNNADSEFLKKVKAAHPSLTPNDLKLCAYLRLNLSSKEIAQLLHISPRSVEIKRYRLRKKLGLQHEDNLVNYILEL
ncbi:helix-turn-helix and ligand-binding sensor domain-containing protein [Ulvibacterium marinum]|uniref:helix-turn-helix and ligand-binding sensor domain-containing protein n=1 Tax=Ulvibacterium marinum TaxID=2419782 RepID=UPI001FECCF95|nr:triple tyrosine motif-containing protein [Ulvibacterium marinum]